MTWQVQLEGDARELEFLAGVLTSGSRTVLPGAKGAGYVYQSDSFQNCSTSDEVEELAGSEVAVLSGILRLERQARNGLTYGAVYRVHPDGRRDIFVRIQESIEVKAEISGVTAVVMDAAGNVIPPPPPPPARAMVLAQLAASDAAVAKVLRLLNGADAKTWVGLYRIHEVIDEDVGGQHRLEKSGWGSADDLRRFKHSANSVLVGGDESRHGKEPQVPPKNPMTLSEAEAYNKYIVQAWLACKGG